MRGVEVTRSTRFLLLVVMLVLPAQALAVDVDEDGYDSVLDCNDLDPAVNPGATEVCNGRDDNCDTVVDEGFDVDGDGASQCTGDCDDDNADVHPGVAEICDGIDNDCDLSVDEGFDADEDGFSVCAEIPDCNDQDAAVHPEADEECNARDDNCDGQVDEGLDCAYMNAGAVEGLGDHGAMGGGCNCETSGAPAPTSLLGALLLAGLCFLRRR